MKFLDMFSGFYMHVYACTHTYTNMYTHRHVFTHMYMCPHMYTKIVISKTSHNVLNKFMVLPHLQLSWGTVVHRQ